MLRASAVQSLRLNPNLRPDAYGGVFRAHRRLHIPDILDAASAGEVLFSVEAARNWVRAIHLADGQDVDITMAELEAMTEKERAELERSLIDRSTDSVKYMFDAVRITPDLNAGKPVEPSMRALHEFVNGRAFLDFMTSLTGDKSIASADVMATRYLEGHFATAHADALTGAKRLYAYVLNLTPIWRADWGGVLMFIDEDGHVAEGYTPRFNALNVFAVPQTHAVSVVTRLAPAPRYSITGWLHAKA
jgi:Rps23 Pro-64 3,4-dihydroxylase Tpa1-like proline 4-hydroxylase